MAIMLAPFGFPLTILRKNAKTFKSANSTNSILFLAFWQKIQANNNII